MLRSVNKTLLAVSVAATFGAFASDSLACGGFFCDQGQPVNQAAERIVFSENGDGTVTAVIQILYAGPSESFSWLLPISSVPMEDELAVASDVVFQRLQAATNPVYRLVTQVEGECAPEGDESGSAGASAEGGSGGAPAGGGPVNVEARGIIGSFEWEVISIAASEENPTDVAVGWLSDNGYDVPEGTPGLLRPYLEDGLYLLALRLTKGSDVGSIRPIVLTYDASRPVIPIRPTAVAANENMGVMTWVLGEGRAVPQNYRSLELNEARLNWFNPASNYDAVVTAAADEAGGQGFVTEYSNDTLAVSQTVWSTYDEETWIYYVDQQDSGYAFYDIWSTWGGWDGFWETVRETLTPPTGTTWDEVIECPECYNLGAVSLSGTEFMTRLEAATIEPVRAVQRLINAQPEITRLYSTLSASEMTVDPVFTFNPDLPPIDNFHFATRVIECGPTFYQSEAPFRIELPQGGVVRGTAEQAANRTWPDDLASMPANLRISQLSESGDGRVLEDNGELIIEALDNYNATVPISTGSAATGSGGDSGATGNAGEPGQGGSAGRGGTGGSARGGRGGQTTGAVGGTDLPDSGVDPMGENPMTTPPDEEVGPELERTGCICGVAHSGRDGRALVPFALLALGLLARRRLRR